MKLTPRSYFGIEGDIFCELDPYKAYPQFFMLRRSYCHIASVHEYLCRFSCPHTGGKII